MKTYIIDTNALISFVTDRNPVQQEIISELFEQAAALRCKIICHQHVVTEFVYVLEKIYNHPKKLINQMITDFMALPGIEIRHEIDFKVLLAQWPDSVSDFGDAVVSTLWASNKESSIVTFDSRFTKEVKKLGAAVCKLQT